MRAVLPLKDFVSAKRRLSGVLSPVERRRLFQAMVEDLLAVLASSPCIDSITIVSEDPSARQLAASVGADFLHEPAPCDGFSALNLAVAAGCEAMARGYPGSEILVLHADLPQLTEADIEQLAEARQRQLGQARAADAVLLSPDRQATGTNAIVLAAGLVERMSATLPNGLLDLLQFGADSFNRHSEIMARHGLICASEKTPGFSADVDTPGDLLALMLGGSPEQGAESVVVGRRLHAYCSENAIGQRMQMMWMLETEEGEEQADEHAHDDAEFELPSQALAMALVDADLPGLLARAAALRDAVHGDQVSYSKKVFIPLTRLCRDVCHYCTFATTPRNVDAPYLSVDEVLALAREGEKMGCKEALFTLGEKPELRYRAAREALAEMGFATTLEYVAHVAGRVASETSLLPHINAGCMSDEEIAFLKPVSASMGIMLESASDRLTEKGMPHYGSPDKVPAVRLATIERAGEHAVPFTSGLLIGIGETRAERIDALLQLRASHLRHGHLQEIIVQNFRAKPGTKMSQAPDADLDELLWTIAVARIIFGPHMHIQAPPNLSPGELEKIVAAGIDDWGGVSPLTPDHVNPEAPWPHLDELARQTQRCGKVLVERLTAYPDYIRLGKPWFDEAMLPAVQALSDAQGWPRTDDWVAGVVFDAPQWWSQHQLDQSRPRASARIAAIVARASRGIALQEAEVVELFGARNDDFWHVCHAANALRQVSAGDTVRYVVNRNINYTNICYFKCQFCAFSKGKHAENLRGKPYDLSIDEIQRRAVEAWERGATEVCLQGGIHPSYTGQTYIDICHAIKAVVPDMHIHAFSPLEVWQGARSMGDDIAGFLTRLRDAGLSTLPGTAAEILDDEVRSTLCPEKIRTEQWLHVMEQAHRLGVLTTATIMYGHIESPVHWARHLLRIRALQEKTGGFTEFVPLPFVPNEAPIYLKGKARRGPTFREAVLMHAVARLVLHGQIDNIQTSWVKMGEQGIAACLSAGANDLGGTLMNETITRSAGAQHGQELPPAQMDAMIEALGRVPQQRRTDYGSPDAARVAASYAAKPLQDVENTEPQRYADKPALHRPGLDDGDTLIASAS